MKRAVYRRPVVLQRHIGFVNLTEALFGDLPEPGVRLKAVRMPHADKVEVCLADPLLSCISGKAQNPQGLFRIYRQLTSFARQI